MYMKQDGVELNRQNSTVTNVKDWEGPYISQWISQCSIKQSPVSDNKILT